MGLDMYLIGKRYIWDFDKDDAEIVKKVSSCFPEIGSVNVRAVEVELMYWRKSNAIHRWFVENVQDGIDDCGEYVVMEHDLVALRDACQQVVDDPQNAHMYLPCKKGFCFGSADYSQDYFDDISRTLHQLNTMIVLHKMDRRLQLWSFFYQASW